MKRAAARALLVTAGLVLVAWVALATYWVTLVVRDGCLTASVVEYPPDLDCGDARRAAGIVISGSALVAFPAAALLALPHWLATRRRGGRAAPAPNP